MKNVLFTIAIVLGFGLTGCKQDPLSGYSDSVRNAHKPGEKPQPGTPSDSLFIDVNDFYDVKEGDSVTITIGARVIIPKLGYQLSIENIADFPQSRFDSKTGVFTWTPNSFVKSGSEVVAKLKILMVTTGAEQLVRRREVPIIVRRQFFGPDVQTANSLQDMVEGDVDTFTVTVRSPDSGSLPPSLTPVLVRTGMQDGTSFIALDPNAATNPVQSTLDPNQWTFYMKIDLGDAEITDSQTQLYFGLQATANGLASTVKSFFVNVKTNFNMPSITWLNDADFTAGKETNFQFMIYDIKNEGRVSATINNCADMPGAKCTCVNVGRAQVQCSIDWTPAATLIGKTTRVSIDTVNASPIPGDPRNQTKSYNGYLKVVGP